ncbi:MAG TPA: type I glyceraldehyde-3-phosphate dehydrogenase [Firmicutes bacterium]|nr:type I glyceraldehyde-3-phosphate dehydrogenase [Bacillota bacterium]
MVRLGINGFGRIGRGCIRAAFSHPEVEIAAINSTRPPELLGHMLKYDSLYGIFEQEVQAKEGMLVVGGKEIKILAERDPAKLNWDEAGVDIVIEATGVFRNAKDASAHIKGGVKKVIITAPGKGVDNTIVMGVNEDTYDKNNHHIISNASCTTNCLAPVAKVLLEEFGLIRGLMTTVHSYTTDQKLLDAGHKDFRRARAAGLSMVPTTTGAAQAVGLVLPALKGKLNGLAVRVPTPTVSMVDLVAELGRETTVEEINAAFETAAAGPLKGILGITDLPLVSVDFKGDSRSSIVDASSTMVAEGNLAKVLAWYDNEWAYSVRVLDLAAYMARQGL